MIVQYCKKCGLIYDRWSENTPHIPQNIVSCIKCGGLYKVSVEAERSKTNV